MTQEPEVDVGSIDSYTERVNPLTMYIHLIALEAQQEPDGTEE